MAIIVCHSPKGGTGTTFVAAQLAHFHAESGRAVTLVGTSEAALALHCVTARSRYISSLNDRQAVCTPGSVDIRRHAGAANDPDLVALLIDLGFADPAGDRLLIVDAASGDQALASRLAAIAALRLCVLTAAPDTLALLPDVLDTPSGTPDLFVLNAFDETRRIERHGAAFTRELLGERLIGRIRRDVSVIEAIAAMQPLSVHAPASSALTDLRAVAEIVAARLAESGSAADVLQLPASAILAA